MLISDKTSVVDVEGNYFSPCTVDYAHNNDEIDHDKTDTFKQ